MEDIATIYESIKVKLLSYRSLGFERLESGVILIGKAPHIGTSAWLHKIYPGLSCEEIGLMEDQLGSEIPASYKQFLSIANGLKVFIDTLSLDGLRVANKRDISEAWQPYSLVETNTLYRPKNLSKDFFIIGGYSWDGSLVGIRSESDIIFRINKDSLEVLNTWDSLGRMLEFEVNRICNLFNAEGKKIEPNSKTSPD